MLECGRRFADDELPRSTWDLRRYFYAPRLGMRGIFRLSTFRDVTVVSGAGVGGGSLGYANTLYRAPKRFYADPQWADLEDWERALAPHFDEAERMLGVTEVVRRRPRRRPPARVRARDRRRRAPTPRRASASTSASRASRSPDPYFGGEGPDRTGCILCGRCMVGCPYNAKNTLVKNYLWFAEKRGARGHARARGRRRPPGRRADDGSEGYVVTTERPGAWLRRDRQTFTARGVVLAAGALGTNKLLARAQARPARCRSVSDRLGRCVRTNSEAILAVTLPKDSVDLIKRVAITGSVYPDPDTHVETVTYGDAGDAISLLYTLMVGDGTRVTRPLKLLATIARHPLRLLRTISPRGWSRRTIIVLVMQTLDNAISLHLKRGLLRRACGCRPAQDPERPEPDLHPGRQPVRRVAGDAARAGSRRAR